MQRERSLTAARRAAPCATWQVTLDTPMEPGVVLTIEPGLYLPDSEDIPKGLRGIGIRLEDDVAVRDGDPWVLLSGDVPLPPEEEEEEALVGTQVHKNSGCCWCFQVCCRTPHGICCAFVK